PALAPADSEYAGGGRVFEAVHAAAWPSQRDLISPHVTAKAEMQPEVVLRNVASAASHFVDLPLGAHGNFDSRSDAVPVRLASDGHDLNPVVAIAALVAKQEGRTIHVINGDVHAAIVVVVGKGYTATGTHKL